MHAVIENFAPPALLNSVAATWPRDDWPHWHRYHDQHSVKLASKDAHRLPDAARLVVGWMAGMNLHGLCDRKCFPDLDLHGAGLHAILPGGHLARHLDGATHPLTGWRRELNAVLFVDDWDPAWGGDLQFSDEHARWTEAIEPRFNRLVLFTTGEKAFHEVKPVTGPQPRRTLSLFWWSHATPESKRDRAEFVTNKSLTP